MICVAANEPAFFVRGSGCAFFYLPEVENMKKTVYILTICALCCAMLYGCSAGTAQTAAQTSETTAAAEQTLVVQWNYAKWL